MNDEAREPSPSAAERDAAVGRVYGGGALPSDVAADLGVSIETLKGWMVERSRELARWAAENTLPEVVEARRRSEALAKRAPETKATFEDLLAGVFVALLKPAGYKRRRNTWWRRGDEVWPVVDVQRGSSAGDLLSFTVNWGLHVPGYVPLAWGGPDRVQTYSTPIMGRIGGFLPDQLDVWWSVQVGVLGRWHPPARLRPPEVEDEIRLGLQRTIAFLDRFQAIDDVLALLQGSIVVPRSSRPATNNDPIELLRQLRTS